MCSVSRHSVPVRHSGGGLVPLLFTPDLWEFYVGGSSWLSPMSRAFHCLLFGTRAPHALTVRAILGEDLSDADRAVMIGRIRDEHLVLLGQAKDVTEPCLPRVNRLAPYVYLVSHVIEGQLVTSCHSVDRGRVTTHPLAILDEHTQETFGF